MFNELGPSSGMCDPTLVGTGMATENVKRVVAMKNRQCLNSMADYVSIANEGLETSSTKMFWLGNDYIYSYIYSDVGYHVVIL